jgi:hypothetical protein
MILTGFPEPPPAAAHANTMCCANKLPVGASRLKLASRSKLPKTTNLAFNSTGSGFSGVRKVSFLSVITNLVGTACTYRGNVCTSLGFKISTVS